jgi:hypothetical protein
MLRRLAVEHTEHAVHTTAVFNAERSPCAGSRRAWV